MILSPTTSFDASITVGTCPARVEDRLAADGGRLVAGLADQQLQRATVATGDVNRDGGRRSRGERATGLWSGLSGIAGVAVVAVVDGRCSIWRALRRGAGR